MVYVDHNGEAHPLYLRDLQGPDGKIPLHRVNIRGGRAQNYYAHICQYITPQDYDGIASIVPDPEVYDFKKILNW